MLKMRWKPPKLVFICSAIGASVGIAICIKDYMGGSRFENPIRADGKVVIVTGGNTGIGKETVRELASRGAKVYMACRDMKKCEAARQEIVLETSNKYVYCRLCDLASLKSINRFVEEFKKKETHLDILINNAGVMRCPQSKTIDGFETQLGVNHLGHFYLTNSLLDILKAPGRIVNVSSIAHVRGEINRLDLNSEVGYDPGKAYNQSKLANVMFTRELAKRLEGTGITVNAVHPGIVDTELIRHMSFFSSYLASIFLKPFIWMFIKTPKQGAQTTLYAALEPSLEKVTGKYFSDNTEREVAPQAKDEQTSKWLWNVSAKWTRI